MMLIPLLTAVLLSADASGTRVEVQGILPADHATVWICTEMQLGAWAPRHCWAPDPGTFEDRWPQMPAGVYLLSVEAWREVDGKVIDLQDSWTVEVK